MWEYDRTNFEAHKIIEINAKLNELGALGWEVIYYKEEKPEKLGTPYKITVLLKRKIN